MVAHKYLIRAAVVMLVVFSRPCTLSTAVVSVLFAPRRCVPRAELSSSGTHFASSCNLLAMHIISCLI